MSALLAIDIEQGSEFLMLYFLFFTLNFVVRADAIANGRVPPGGKTSISLGSEGPQPGSFSPRRNRTFESTVFKESCEVPASPDRPAKKSAISSPKPSISECFKTAEPVSKRSSSGIAFSKNSTASKLLCKSYSKTFQSSLFTDDEDQAGAPISSPRSAKKPVSSAPKTHIGPVFDRSSNQENNMNQSNTIRPSKRPTNDEKTSMKQVFDKNTPIKRKPSKKVADDDKTTMNLVLSQVKLENTSRVRMSPGGPTAILLA